MYKKIAAFSDEFDKPVLDSKWRFDNPAPNPGGQSYSLTENPGFLRMTTTGHTDLIGNEDTAPKMLEGAPQGDFQIVLRVLASPDVYFEHAGILVMQDSMNWVRLIRDSNQNSVFLQGSSSAWFFVSCSAGDVILRLTKNGPDYAGAFSTDGTSFIEVGTTTTPLTSHDIGMTVVSTPEGNVFSADFDYFRAYVPVIQATVTITPDTLNLKSQGKFVTCYIELPPDYHAQNISVASVALAEVNGNLLDPPLYTVGPAKVGDYDGNGIPDLMVKFDRQKLASLLAPGEAKLTVAGELADGAKFEGTDTIRVIGKSKK